VEHLLGEWQKQVFFGTAAPGSEQFEEKRKLLINDVHSIFNNAPTEATGQENDSTIPGIRLPAERLTARGAHVRRHQEALYADELSVAPGPGAALSPR
jgi:hypothetical protein